MERKSPFDLEGFEPRRPASTERRPTPEDLERIAAETGFPSRSPSRGANATTTPKQAPPVTQPPSIAAVEPASPLLTAADHPTGLAQPRRPARRGRKPTGYSFQRNFKLNAATIVALDEEAELADITLGQVIERGVAAIKKLRELKIDDY